MRGKRLRLWLLLFLAAGGCQGDDGTGPSDGGSGATFAGGSGGAAGTAGSGVAGQGGSGASGSSAAGASGSTGGTAGPAGMGGMGGTGGMEELTLGGLPVKDLCSPGEYLFQKHIDCDPGLGGIVDGETLTVIQSVELPSPMTPGQRYSISLEHQLELANPAAWIQDIYGAMSLCAQGGEKADLLATQMLDRGFAAYCSTLMPQKPYTHVILVTMLKAEEGFMARGGYQFCPNADCP